MTEANAATANPPAAGPTARARLNAALFKAMALGNSSRGTSSGTIACQVGAFIAVPALNRKVKMSNSQAPIQPPIVSPLNNAATTSIQLPQNNSNRRRSKMSAMAPAGNPNSNTGRLAAVCMSAMSSGEEVSAVINHVPAVSCIQLPVLEIMEAHSRFRKRGRRNGTQADNESLACDASVMAGFGRFWRNQTVTNANINHRHAFMLCGLKNLRQHQLS